MVLNHVIIPREKDWARILRETCSNQTPILFLSGFLPTLREPPWGANILLGWWSSTTSRTSFSNGDWFSKLMPKVLFLWALLRFCGKLGMVAICINVAKGLSAVTFSVLRLLPGLCSHLFTQGESGSGSECPKPVIHPILLSGNTCWESRDALVFSDMRV